MNEMMASHFLARSDAIKSANGMFEKLAVAPSRFATARPMSMSAPVGTMVISFLPTRAVV